MMKNTLVVKITKNGGHYCLSSQFGFMDPAGRFNSTTKRITICDYDKNMDLKQNGMLPPAKDIRDAQPILQSIADLFLSENSESPIQKLYILEHTLHHTVNVSEILESVGLIVSHEIIPRENNGSDGDSVFIQST